MQKHIMTFSSFLDKHLTQEYIKECILPDNEDECFAELKYIFFTGCELTKHQVRQVEQNCKFISYTSSDY